MRSLTSLIILSLIACSSSLVYAQKGPTPVHTNKSRFRIPYRYDAEEMSRLKAQEIRLYTSINSGERWQIAQTVPPSAGKFEFQSPADGEYWFAVRTLDGNNNLHPGGENFTAGLKVVVDTTAPKLDLTLRQMAPGKVQLTWNAKDNHLNTDELVLEFVQAGKTEWQAIRIVPDAIGETSWTVPEGGIVAVRGKIKDRAGNEGSAQMQISVDPLGANVPKAAQPDFRRPVASGPQQEDRELADVFPARTPTATESAFAPAPHPFLNAQSKQPIPTPQIAQDAFAEPESLQRPKEIPVADSTEKRPDALQGRYRDKNDSQQKPIRPSGPVRIVNSTQFDLAYQLDNVAAPNRDTVELFITQDQGDRWWRYGIDEDRTSPFTVKVPLDGVYGFTMRVRSESGLTQEPPANGDAPDMSVIVDQTPPVAKLKSIKPQTGSEGTEVLVQWEIAEPNPSGAPVALSYSVAAEGPWIPITGWQADSSQFTWKLSADVPQTVFLKLDARDAAGNFASVITDQPLSFGSESPSARIVDVEAGVENGVRQ